VAPRSIRLPSLTRPGSPVVHPPVRTAGALVAGVRRIGVIRASALGDFVQALPAFDALRVAYAAAEIVLVGTTMHEALLAGRPSPVDRVVALPRGAIWHIGRALGRDRVARPGPDTPPDIRPADILARLRAEAFDLVVQLHGGGGESNPVARALGARLTVGSAARGVEPLDRSVPFEHFQSETARTLEVMGLVGAPPVTLEPRLAVTAADRAAASSVLPPSSAPLAVLHPGASDPRRRWSPERFALVGDALAERGLEVAITGTGDDEGAIATDITAGMRHEATSLVDRLSIPALVGILARASIVVANDTGPLHLASAVGTPTVGIYWLGNLITGGPPFRSRTRAVVSWRPDCPACGADATETRGCDHVVSFVDDVPVERVLELAADLLARR
jgi:ADP-heptose:LPS heptosyltransferase